MSSVFPSSSRSCRSPSKAPHAQAAPELSLMPWVGPWWGGLKLPRKGRRAGREEAPQSPPDPDSDPAWGLILDMLRSAVPPEDALHRFSLCNGGHGSRSDPGGPCVGMGPELWTGNTQEEPSPWLWTGCGNGRKCGISG